MSDVEHLFVCASHLYVFFGEMSVPIFCSFTDCVVFSILRVMMSCLYILEINPLSVSSFANIFSHSEGCLFTLFMTSLAVKKLLSLIRSHLFLFFYFYYSRRWIKQDLTEIYVRVL